ncbi:conserved membrane protein of unknown function [Tenacibaculum sp. 190524A02b]
MKQLHYISGITITLFILLHLSNHLFSLLGVEKHLEVMTILRVFYRNIIVEFVLVCAILLQIVSGITLFFRKRKVANSFLEKLQLWSGGYLAIFFVFHLTAVFVGRLVLNLDTNIYFGVAGLNTFPFLLFFIPYYVLAIISFFGHIAAIHSIKMKKKVLGVTPNKQAYFIVFIGIVVSIVVIYGLTNGFKGIEIPKDYHVMIGK